MQSTAAARGPPPPAARRFHLSMAAGALRCAAMLAAASAALDGGGRLGQAREGMSTATHVRRRPRQVPPGVDEGDSSEQSSVGDGLLALAMYDVGCGRGGSAMSEAQCLGYASLDLGLRYGGAEQEPSAPSGCYQIDGVVFFNRVEKGGMQRRGDLRICMSGERIQASLLSSNVVQESRKPNRSETASVAAAPAVPALGDQASGDSDGPEAASGAELWQRVEAIAAEADAHPVPPRAQQAERAAVTAGNGPVYDEADRNIALIDEGQGGMLGEGGQEAEDDEDEEDEVAGWNADGNEAHYERYAPRLHVIQRIAGEVQEGDSARGRAIAHAEERFHAAASSLREVVAKLERRRAQRGRRVRRKALMRSEQPDAPTDSPEAQAPASSRRRCCCEHRRRRQGGGDAAAYGAHHKCADSDDGVPWDMRCVELHRQWDCA